MKRARRVCVALVLALGLAMVLPARAADKKSGSKPDEQKGGGAFVVDDLFTVQSTCSITCANGGTYETIVTSVIQCACDCASVCGGTCTATDGSETRTCTAT